MTLARATKALGNGRCPVAAPRGAKDCHSCNPQHGGQPTPENEATLTLWSSSIRLKQGLIQEQRESITHHKGRADDEDGNGHIQPVPLSTRSATIVRRVRQHD